MAPSTKRARDGHSKIETLRVMVFLPLLGGASRAPFFSSRIVWLAAPRDSIFGRREKTARSGVERLQPLRHRAVCIRQLHGAHMQISALKKTAALVALVLGLFLGEGSAMATEQAKYEVLERDGDIELRRYAPQVVAETLVEGDFNEVGNQGVRRLAAYIFGENRSRGSIAMTAPVTQAQDSEKIPMTAPVNQERVADRWRITFVMPEQYTLETLPEPLDSRIQIRPEDGRVMAALSYSGTWSWKRYQKREERLRTWIAQRRLRVLGEPVFARYDPPFKPWFLRRNEVLIPVTDISLERR